jgi:hypothetical protein
VRSTVDFYWRNKMWDAAIDSLLKAAKSAYPDLGGQLTFEAARKATEAKEYARARQLLTPLLQNQPYNAEYLAAMADTYGREGDDKSLRDFYLARIQAFRAADLPADDKTARIAALRRGLIPALARLKDFAGAVDQYVDILNKFPEDEGFAQEAAAFADHHARRQQLLDYYIKATADSPKDFRWAMVLARIETYFEDYAGAIASYARARTVRPDRADLLTAQASLEERTMRFDDALKSYSQLYQLTYQNPQWMEKIAEFHARKGQTDAAVAALKKALIEGRLETPEKYFAAADSLSSWNMLNEAREFSKHGVELAGKDLLVQPEDVKGALAYVALLTRLRDYSTAYARLMDAAKAAREKEAPPDLNQFLSAMGRVVKDYYTPEEASAFAQFLIKQKEGLETNTFVGTLLPLAQYAGIADLEARWRFEVMMASPGSDQAQAMEARLEELQKQRMRFNEFGSQLEAYWKVLPQKPGKDYYLERAADSYGSGGNTDAELQALQQAFDRQGLDGQHLNRYLELISTRSPEQLVTISAGDRASQVRDTAATTALATGKGDLALRAIAARGRGLPAVWTRAYTGLAGLYYSDPSPAINAAYQRALDTRNIGDRIARPIDRSETLAGDVWFYYGSRYGEYLSVAHRGNPEDYLPAMLEGKPARSDAYFTLADYYRDVGQLDSAREDFAHALELDSQRGDAHDRMAQILWQQGKQEAAIKEWSLALKAFQAQEDGRAVPPTFWANLRATLENIGQRKLLPPLRDDTDRVVRSYVQRNGTYRVDPILRGALAAAGDPVQGADWLVDLSRAAQTPIELLSTLVSASWFPDAQKELVYQRILALAQDEADRTFGAEHSTAIENLTGWQRRWIDFLLDKHRTAEAQNALNKLPERFRDPHEAEGAYFIIHIAAQSNTLEEVLENFQQDPEKAPPLDDLRNQTLYFQEKDPANYRRLLKYIYTREINEHDLAPANFLGLAEVRLQQGDVAQAVSLLRRMARVAGEPFENLEAAGDLLLKLGHPAEATEFYDLRVKAVPWDAEARLKLARAEMGANSQPNDAIPLLTAVASSPIADYSTRVAAAEFLATVKTAPASLGSAELDWVVKGGSMAAAESPGFFYSRILAANKTPDPGVKLRLLLEAIAMHPEDLKQRDSAPPAEAGTPDSVSPRILLFQAAVAISQNELALSALTPLINQSLMTSPARESSESEGASEDFEQPGASTVEAEFLSGQQLDASHKSLIAAQMAGALQKLDRLEEAGRIWKVASMLATDDSLRNQANLEIKHLEAQLKMQKADQQRRPLITEHLEQQRLVRPRLLGGNEPSAHAGVAGGGGQ